MATFNVGKGKDDIQKGVLLPEDWYLMKITREPYQDKNSAWKEAGESLPFQEAIKINSKAGENIVVNLKVESDVPEFDGRPFTKWLSLPNPSDESKYMNDGQPKADWKAEWIHAYVEAFGGSSDGGEVSLGEGQVALIYVVQEIDNRTNENINSISMNVKPRSAEGSTDPLGSGEATGGTNPLVDNDIPF